MLFGPEAIEIANLVIYALGVFLILAMAMLANSQKWRKEHQEVVIQTQQLREEIAGKNIAVERLPVVEAELHALKEDISAEKQRTVALNTEIQQINRTHEARLDELRGMKKEVENSFSSLASSVLKSNSESFLNLVSERFKQHSSSANEDLSKRQLAIQNLVKPLEEKLGLFDNRIKEIEIARNKAYGEIQEQVKSLTEGQKSLGQETRKLVQALRSPKTRGRWGEMQLRQVFEMAGMAENVDYILERQVETDEGVKRPDAVVKIPGGKSIVVDAKTPLVAFLDALESDTPQAQQELLKRHAGHVRQHVKMLASKSYQDAIASTPDFVVMFIPGESFVSAAAEADPSLIEYAFENKVLIATPTTLMALIKAIAYGWQQEKMAKNASEVQTLAKELYDRLATFAGHIEKVGKSLGQSVENYNRAIGSLESRVLTTTRKFESLGVVSPQSEIGVPKSVESEPRLLTASEFTQNKED